MLISVIIPVYKVEPYIVRCIDSVLNQTCRQIEVILVDDCSPDRSMDLAKDFIRESPKSQDLNIQILKHDRNLGLSAARNTGIKAATGDYLYFLDSDDEIPYDCFDSLLKESNGGILDVVFAGNVEVRGNNVYNCSPLENYIIYDSHEIIKAFINGNIAIISCNKLIKRNIATEKDLWFKEGIVNEDELWTFLMINCISSIRYIAKVTYIYHIHSNSISTGPVNQLKIDSLVAIIEEMAQLLNSGKIFQCKENVDYIQHKRLIWLSTIIRSKITWKEKWAYFLRFYSLPIGNNMRFLWNFTTSQMTNLLYPYRRNVSLWIRKKFSS